MDVTALRRYPVKSLAGSPETRLVIQPWGPEGDRRWAVVGADGRTITAREMPGMLSLQATVLGGGGVRITTSAGASVDVDPPDAAAHDQVLDASGDPVVSDGGEAAADLLSAELGRPVHLVWQADPKARPVNPRRGGRPGDVLSLADAGPLLLVSAASLARLQEWVGEEPALSVWRFRPNVVVEGGEPFAEDTWASVRIGAVDFRIQHACDRCVMTTIDPATQQKGPEPIRTLARHRKWDGKVWFGVWLVPLTTGEIGVGDPVLPDSVLPDSVESRRG